MSVCMCAYIYICAHICMQAYIRFHFPLIHIHKKMVLNIFPPLVAINQGAGFSHSVFWVCSHNVLHFFSSVSFTLLCSVKLTRDGAKQTTGSTEI